MVFFGFVFFYSTFSSPLSSQSRPDIFFFSNSPDFLDSLFPRVPTSSYEGYGIVLWLRISFSKDNFSFSFNPARLARFPYPFPRPFRQFPLEKERPWTILDPFLAVCSPFSFFLLPDPKSCYVSCFLFVEDATFKVFVDIFSRFLIVPTSFSKNVPNFICLSPLLFSDRGLQFGSKTLPSFFADDLLSFSGFLHSAFQWRQNADTISPKCDIDSCRTS